MTHKLLVVIALLLVCSCSVTRHIPEGEYLLQSNIVKSDKTINRKERVPSTNMEQYVLQSPNRKVFGMNIPIFIYALSNPEKDNAYNRFLRRIGSEPVIFDSLSVVRSANNIKTYLNSSGYLSSEVSYTIEKENKKAKVIYTATQNEPYRIGKISYDYRDTFIGELLGQDSLSSLLHTGDIFDTKVLDNERMRITQFLKNNGYYSFSVSNISYLADSLDKKNVIDLKLILRKTAATNPTEDQPKRVNNPISRISNIYILPSYNPSTAVANASSNTKLDTLTYRGLNVIFDKELNLRPNVLREVISIYPNELYRSDMVNKTYNTLIKGSYFNSANILFRPDTTRLATEVTLLSDNPDKPEQTTKENYLNCTILATPSLRQSYKVELETSIASNFYALIASLGYQNRNLFKGMEIFDVSISGGYEFMRSETSTTSFEIGGSTSISFPRFIFPKASSFDNVMNANTKVELSINRQQRPYYNRTLSTAAWGYNWINNKNSSFNFRLIDISLVNLDYIDPVFWDDLENPYLQNSYTSQLIAGSSLFYMYNNQVRGQYANSIQFKANLESMGNFLSGVSKLFMNKVDGEDYYEINKIRYAQYIRGEASFVNNIMLHPKVSLAYRLLAGAGLSYGNSESIPFDRLFYCGGSNSMRGWVARTLGPGEETITNTTYNTQLGNMRMEANLEIRFPVWGILHGAVFCDVGNIWFMKASDTTAEGVFKFNNFYRQLGFNTGLGARLDFDFFILRLDWGIKLHNPNNPVGERWINGFSFSDTSFNFGVGYPF